MADNIICTNRKGEFLMAKNIEWLKSLDEARDTAGKTGKLILLDFYNPN